MGPRIALLRRASMVRISAVVAVVLSFLASFLCHGAGQEIAGGTYILYEKTLRGYYEIQQYRQGGGQTVLAGRTETLRAGIPDIETRGRRHTINFVVSLTPRAKGIVELSELSQDTPTREELRRTTVIVERLLRKKELKEALTKVKKSIPKKPKRPEEFKPVSEFVEPFLNEFAACLAEAGVDTYRIEAEFRKAFVSTDWH